MDNTQPLEVISTQITADYHAFLVGADSLVNAAYAAFEAAINCHARRVWVESGAVWYESTPDQDRIIDSYWNAYLDLHRVLHSIILCKDKQQPA